MELVKTSHLLGPERAQRVTAPDINLANLSSISGNHMMEGKYKFSALHMGVWFSARTQIINSRIFCSLLPTELAPAISRVDHLPRVSMGPGCGETQGH